MMRTRTFKQSKSTSRALTPKRDLLMEDSVLPMKVPWTSTVNNLMLQSWSHLKFPDIAQHWPRISFPPLVKPQASPLFHLHLIMTQRIEDLLRALPTLRILNQLNSSISWETKPRTSRLLLPLLSRVLCQLRFRCQLPTQRLKCNQIISLKMRISSPSPFFLPVRPSRSLLTLPKWSPSVHCTARQTSQWLSICTNWTPRITSSCQHSSLKRSDLLADLHTNQSQSEIYSKEIDNFKMHRPNMY